MEKIVVIGSNSFSGASFIDYCLEQGLRVIGMSRSEQANPVFLPYAKRAGAPFVFMQLDLNRDLTRIAQVIGDEKPDYVVNFAAQAMVAQSWEHPEHWFQTNAVATVALHDRLRTFGWLKKYVHVSTPEVYGTCSGLVPENTNYNPSTPYAVSRAAADMSLMSFFKAYNFPVVFTRAANVYGPGQQLYRIIPRAALFFLTGRTLELHGGGHSLRSFIHIRDVADATLRIARNARPPEIYHISTTRVISIRDLTALIAERMGVDFAGHVKVVGERLGKDAAYLLDSAKVRADLGWEDKIGLEQGVDETCAWVRDNLDVLETLPQDYIHKP